MKIIFNLDLNSWFWQIYDELRRNHEIIIPKYNNSRLLNNSEMNIEI